MAHAAIGWSGRHDHDTCIADALTTAEDLCRTRGVRLTALRRRVLELIWDSHRPIGAYAMLSMLRDERDTAAPPTVYRALDFLMEHGLIHRIESLNAYVGCGSPDGRHGGQFLICRDCRAVAELDDDTIARSVAKRARAMGFVVEQQTVEVIGLCPRCARLRPADDAHAP